MRHMALPLDVCIRGGGIVGRTLALLLARDRLRVGLVDTTPAPDTSTSVDVRAYALNRASKELLESLRCWPADDAVTPVTRMQIHGDQASELNFDATGQGTTALAWIVDVPALEAQLLDAVRYQPQIELLSTPAPATLTVVCEGRNSRTRDEFGVEFDVTPYSQHALAARIQCEQPHAQVARQWFAHGEILAFLPIGGRQGNSVAIVWSVSAEHATRLLAASPQAFCQELEDASAHELGSLVLASERRVWPLQKAQARQWSGRAATGAWVLAGDAAHNVHPLAGQGLNLGLADVDRLARVLRERPYWRDVGDDKLLRQYVRARKAGMLLLDAGMDGLQVLFAREGEAWSKLRGMGMQGVEHSGLLKQWLARQAMNF